MLGTILAVALGLFVLSAIIWFIVVEISAHRAVDAPSQIESHAESSPSGWDEDPMDLVPPRS